MGKRGSNTTTSKRNTLPGGGGGSKKDSGLPAYFRHRKMADMAKQAKVQGAPQARVAMAADGIEIEQATPSLKHSLTGMNARAEKEADEMDALVEKEVADDGTRLDASIRNRDSSSKAYARELKKVVEEAEVLIEVLDARDPLGCRSRTTERLVLGADKRLVFVLSKIDLVPKSNVEAWLKYLRHEAPTLAFKASTQQQRNHLAHGAASFGSKPGASAPKFGTTTRDAANADATSALSAGSEAVGAQALFQLLKVFARSTKASLTVGVFGAPNVGKSSLVNTLARARKCAVASTPGHTKVMQSVSIDDKLRLIDSPGVVFQDASLSAARAVGEVDPQQAATLARAALLRNVIKVELVEDPVAPVEAILDRVDHQALCNLYGLGTNGFEKGNVHDFLLRVALRKGRIGRGGIADVDGAARNVLHDWNVGKIRYMTIPPAVHPSLSSSDVPSLPAASGPSDTTSVLAMATALPGAGASAAAAHTAGASLVSSFSEAFDLSALLGEADAEAFASDALPDDDEFERVQRARDTEAARRANIPAPPPRRYAVAAEAAADDEQPKGDLSTTSTLGKRSRALKDESDEESSDEEEEEAEEDEASDQDEDAAQVNASLSVPGAWEARTATTAATAVAKPVRPLPLTTRKRTKKGTAADEDLDIPVAAEVIVDETQTPSLPDWLERQHARAATARSTLPSLSSSSHHLDTVGRGTHAELATMFSASELAHLAPSRGGARRKARKAAKREGRVGGGLVAALEGGLGLGSSGAEAGGIRGEQSRFAALGMEGSNKSKKKKKKQKRAQGGHAAPAIDEDEEL